MLIFADIRVARVALYVWVELTDTLGDLLVAHIDTRVSFLRREVSRRGYELPSSKAGSQQWQSGKELWHVEFHYFLTLD